ncbi:hypothetical protein ACLMJK_003316 [Lecanora helva]
MAFLPSYLLDAWHLQHGDEERARRADELRGWTVSSLAEFQFKYQLDKYYCSDHIEHNVVSLAALTIGKILDILQDSGNLVTDATAIAESLSSTTLRQLLEDARTPYTVLRVFDSLHQTSTGRHRRLVDIDEAIIRNEHHIRSRGLANQDGRFLVSLQDLCSIVSPGAGGGEPEKATRSVDNQLVSFTRRDPPKGGLEVLDYRRRRQLSINRNDASYIQVFHRITHGVLQGLDWSNVLVAGGMALTTLLHVDPTKDDDKTIRDPDIDLYIYGLGPDDANRKAEEIHDTWARNLPASATEKLVVKNAKTINLLTSYPNRRIQIVLKLLPTPTDVLLNFDLDACAIGFDGRSVFMLPRCARSIETGYSVFTMDLVWGHHLGDRRASQDSRIFKYADRGFGLRFLPSYARALEEDGLEQEAAHMSKCAEVEGIVSERTRNHEYYRWFQRDRKPNGGEPGLKTLKRIAYLGQDYVRRFYFGATPLTISPRQTQRQLKSLGLDVEIEDGESQRDGEIDEVEDLWHADYDATAQENGTMGMANEQRRAKKQAWEGPIIRLADLDTEDMHAGLPDGRRGLGNLEIFMRHCEAWRLHSRGDATLDMNETATLAYDPETYDDFPVYEWNSSFSVDSFARLIHEYNSNLWSYMKVAICGKLGIPFQMGGFIDYSTRRIRRQVCGPDFKSVQEKQITIPLNVPFGLENYLISALPQEHTDLPSHFTETRPLIPVHNPNSYGPRNGSLPSLRETASESGNLRYWVITNESMWASQHRALDEFAELMWSLFHWFNQATQSSPDPGVSVLDDTSVACWRLARSFRRRLVLPEVPANQVSPVTMKSGLPSLREALLFRPWAFISPSKPHRDYVSARDGEHDLFSEEAVLYPFPDELFWRPSDEGTWAEDGVPEWTEVSAEKSA